MRRLWGRLLRGPYWNDDPPYIQFPAEITGMTEDDGRLYVFTDKKVYEITSEGDDRG